MKVMVFGGDGMLGSDIVEVLKSLNYDVLSPSSDELNLLDLQKLYHCIGTTRPDAIINCAAYHDVGLCEQEPEYTELVNSVAQKALSLMAHKVGAVMIYISTDYVFDGSNTKPYTEMEATNPLNEYGKSKVHGEMATFFFCPRSFILRTSSLYGKNKPRGKGNHFVGTVSTLIERYLKGELKELNFTDDQIMCPTCTWDIAERIPSFLNSVRYGTYHLVSSGNCSWYGLAEEIIRLSDKKIPINKVNSDFFKSNVKKPKYSALDNSKFNKNFPNNQMLHWKEALKNHMVRMGLVKDV